MMYKWLLFVLGVLLTFSVISEVRAHGSGPPFLLVNNKYALSNLVSGFESEFSAGMDVSPEKMYLVNQPIIFSVDQNNILLPDEVKKILDYRWKLSLNDSGTESGLSLQHTFTNVGSHLVTLEAGQLDGNNFTVINSVKIDIVDDYNYVLPTAKISVKNIVTNTGNQVSFNAEVTKDNSARINYYKWKLDDDVYVNDAAPTFTYPTNFNPKEIILEMIDSNGFYGYSYFALNDTVLQEFRVSKKVLWPYYLVGIAGGLPIIVWMVYSFRNRRLRS